MAWPAALMAIMAAVSAAQKAKQDATPAAPQAGQMGGGMQAPESASLTAMKTEQSRADMDPTLGARPSETEPLISSTSPGYVDNAMMAKGNVYDQDGAEDQDRSAKGGKFADYLNKASAGAAAAQGLRGQAPRPPGLPRGGFGASARPASSGFMRRPGPPMTLMDLMRRRGR